MSSPAPTFEQRWSVWLSSCSGLILITTLILTRWIQPQADQSGTLQTAAKQLLLDNLRSYNNITHSIFIGLLLTLTAWTCWSVSNAPASINPAQRQGSWLKQILRAIQKHPATTILLVAYGALMIHESSWFYKEILTWYDDINTDYLLNNFSIKNAFVSETMWRNDFRFFPLSHQDLHVLSWFTPYTKVWSAVSALELIATIIVGCKTIELHLNHKPSRSLYLMGSILFLFTSAAAFNYFQFIYSERVLTLLAALYFYQYSLYQKTEEIRHGRIALALALFIPFFKDTAILLVAIPPLTTITLGSLAKIRNYPRWNSVPFQAWRRAYSTELAICSIIPLFLASFAVLSLLPSTAAGVPRYDSHLGFSSFALDIRLVVFLGFMAVRTWRVCRNRSPVTPLDGINLAALGYGFALFALVGLDGSNYMTLPIQFVAVLDILMIWETIAAPAIHNKFNVRQAQAIALGATLLIVGIEDRQAKTFRARATEISSKQRSWRQTLQTADDLATKAKRQGDEVNLIYTKGWFRSSDQMKTLTYDRLVYYDIDTRTYTIIDGIDRGEPYRPQQGDFLIDIDSGKKTFTHGIQSSDYEPIYQHNPKQIYGRIYRHR